MSAILANRYAIDAPLGVGSNGRVYAARDLLTHEAVAVKVLVEPDARARRRWRREVAALRLLALPGVVGVRDDGEDGGLCFCVTDIVRGVPFPGAPSLSWDELSPLLGRLLRTLAGVHAAGMVHRDIKPANVLVHDGSCTLLDFDLADGAPLDPWSVPTRLVGTPIWLSPEQAAGQPATFASDLYAVGLLAFSALTGSLPHATRGEPREMLRARANDASPSVGTRRADLPAHAVHLIDGLLAISPADRPRSAATALGMISPASARPLPWFGCPAFLARVCDAARAGARVHISGLPRSGRTRLLDEVARALRSEGRLVTWGGGEAPPGGVRLLDDADRVVGDLPAAAVAAWSARSAPPGAWPIPHVQVADLAPLFLGLDRVFHERENAARAVILRSGGLAGRAADEVHGWVEGGGAVVIDGKVELPGGVPTSTKPIHTSSRALEGDEGALLGWLAVAGGGTPVDVLATAAEVGVAAASEALQALARDGLAWVDSSRGWWTSGADPVPPSPGAHARLAAARPAADPRRLVHLIAAGDDRGATAAARAVVQALIHHGQLAEAWTAAAEGLRAARRCEDDGAERALLRLMLRTAFLLNTPQDADRALYEMELSRSPGVDSLMSLARSFHGLFRRVPIADAPPPEPDLQMFHHGMRVEVARRGSLDDERRLVTELRGWAEGASAADRAAYAAWEGRLFYREGRYAEAAERHAFAADHAESARSSIAFRLNQVSALIEAGHPAEASQVAAGVEVAAAAQRQPLYEARAAWLVRFARMRAGEEMDDDPDLLVAIERLGVQDLHAAALLTEAVIVWRRGQSAGVAELAGRASEVWSALGKTWPALLAEALAARAAADGDRARRAGEAALHCPVPGLALQVLALSAWAATAYAAAWQARGEALSASLPRDLRREVLSPAEAWTMLRAPPDSFEVHPNPGGLHDRPVADG